MKVAPVTKIEVIHVFYPKILNIKILLLFEVI